MSNLILVDVNDNIVGTAEKMAVHKAGNLHRAFSAFIFRSKRIFLKSLSSIP